MYFIGKDDGPSIEEYIKYGKGSGNFVYIIISKRMMFPYGGSFDLTMQD
jgi:hypothetical protein